MLTNSRTVCRHKIDRISYYKNNLFSTNEKGKTYIYVVLYYEDILKFLPLPLLHVVAMNNAMLHYAMLLCYAIQSNCRLGTLQVVKLTEDDP